MAPTGQPKDPAEAIAAGKPLLRPGELAGYAKYSFRIQGPPDAAQKASEKHPSEWWGAELSRRWNVYHDLVAMLAELLPVVEEQGRKTRARAQEMAAFARTCTPPESAAPALKERQEVAAAAEELLARLQALLTEAVHAP